MLQDDLAYYIALAHSTLSASILRRLAAGFDNSAREVWQAPDSQLLEWLKPDQLAKLNRVRHKLAPDSLPPVYEKAGVRVLPFASPDYPRDLRQIYDPPFVLFVRGNLEPVYHKTLAIVGTRRYTHYGERATCEMIAALKPFSPCIVSGLAAGIDTQAHKTALEHDLPTVAVFGTGIDQIYPTQNRRLAQQILDAGGALVSEYPIGMPGSRYSFPNRNRIIAGLSNGTLVVEGDVQSGALITARYALEENRHVLAVPGSIFSPMSAGPNQLIREGAVPVHCGQDIADALNWRSMPESRPVGTDTSSARPPENEGLATLTALERNVLLSIGYDATPLEGIQSHHPAMDIRELSATLTMLELQGLIQALPGATFCRN